mgnify:CR=1 FL=1
MVDDWKAEMWAQVLPKIKVREDLVLRAEGHPGWAVRKGSPQLVAVATSFYQHDRKLHSREARLAQYYRRIKQIHNNTGGADLKRFETTREAVRKVRGEVPLRSAHAGGAGLPGVTAAAGRAQPRWARSA